MAKTRRIIKESLTLVDGVVELVDARIPYSSSNPELDSIIKRKPRIVLLNKCDIADPNATKLWIEYYKNNGKYAIPVDCRTGKGLNAFIPTVNKALADVIEKNKARGMENKPLRLMVVGIPNTGKSSFINRMAGNSKAKVADKAGVTRQKQWIKIEDNIELMDTPGVLWPKFESEEVALNLAYTGTIKNDILQSIEIGFQLLKFLIKNCRNNVIIRYKLDDKKIEEIMKSEKEENDVILEILHEIGKKRGALISGGEIDEEKTANIILDDFRSGKLGEITLERL